MKKDASKTHIQISKQKGKIKVSGSINLGYIGNFKNSQIEIRTSSGCIDFVVISPKTIFLFEFKLNKSAEEALKQIDEKEYEKKFSFEGKHVWKIGVNFSSEKRTVDEWKIEE